MSLRNATSVLYSYLNPRLRRKAELLRGYLWTWAGARAGRHFGVGPGVRIYYPENLSIGNDVTIEGPAYIHCRTAGGIVIGSHTSIGPNLWLHCGANPDGKGGFFAIGENSYIGCNAAIGAGGGIRVGSNVLIGQTVNMHAENHVFASAELPIRDQGVSYEGIEIEDDVWIGSKATILDGVTIGRGAVVGAGAVVTDSIPPYAVAVGIPARVIHYRAGAPI